MRRYVVAIYPVTFNLIALLMAVFWGDDVHSLCTGGPDIALDTHSRREASAAQVTLTELRPMVSVHVDVQFQHLAHHATYIGK